MNNLIFFLTALSLSTVALAANTTTVSCVGKLDEKTESVRFRINEQNIIVQWDETTWGKGKGTYFGVYSQPIEEYGFEWDNSFKASNGYSILVLGTTADSHTIGVNLETGTGFYTYKDLGSGNGNRGPIALICRKN